MEFLLSWLADCVDLSSVDDRSNQKRRASRLGERLTSAGLAVEGIRDLPATDGAEADALLDVDVTSNRPDCMSHLGLARELATALSTPLRRPDVPFYGSRSSDGSEGGKVVLEDPEGCPRYVARIVRGVKVGPSPAWMSRRLEAIGVRSINNVVDATNYVLWETGQPVHAFDLATIPGGEIRVRRARPGERLTTLDGKERELDGSILVIADRARAIGLGGIMGGLATEVTERTTDVLIEAAHFDRRRVRIGARRLAMHTDASHRFERGANFEACDEASRRCAALIVEAAGGQVEEPAIDAVARRPPVVGWRLSARELERFAGCAVADLEIERILAALGFAPRTTGDRVWQGEVPSWRAVDFEPRRAAGASAPEAWAQDVFEEVLRHVGLDRIPATLPALGGVDEGGSPAHDRRSRARTLFAGFGFAEGIHFAFHDRAADDRWPAIERAGPPLALSNPLSERYAVLRRSLVPNLVGAAEHNAHRGAEGVRLFEVGHLFPGVSAAETEALAAVAGGAVGSPWDRAPVLDLAELAGCFEALFGAEGGGSDPPRVRPAALVGVVEGTGGEWLDAAGRRLGWFGRLSAADVPFELFAAEVLLERLPPRSGLRAVVAPPRLPSVFADLTLTHPLEVPWADIDAAIRERPTEHLVGFRLRDRWRGEGVPAGAVATTVRFEYNAGERSLTQEEVNERQAALAAELARRFAVHRETPR